MDEFWAEGDIPWLTTEQMVEVDRAMIEDFGIDLVRMMENAGRSLAHLARERFLGGNASDSAIAVLAGPGGNGGGALVAARRLHGYGAQVTVALTRPESAMTPVAAQQLEIVEELGIRVDVGETPLADGDLVIDGLIGYSLNGAPRGNAALLIEWANSGDTPVLSLDAPSGLDTTTGTVFEPAIRASATMTLALPKQGLRAPDAERVVGELYLADISVPSQLYAREPLGLRVGPIFARSDIVRLF